MNFRYEDMAENYFNSLRGSRPGNLLFVGTHILIKTGKSLKHQGYIKQLLDAAAKGINDGNFVKIHIKIVKKCLNF